MTDREREALIDRLKLASAWAFSMNGVPDDPRDDTPMAAIEDAIAVIAASPWLPLPAEVREGEAPWDGKPWLVCNPRYDAKYPCVAAYREEEHFSVDWAKKPSWLLIDEHGYALSEWDDRTEESYPVSCPFDPTHYAPIAPLPAPPAGEVG